MFDTVPPRGYHAANVDLRGWDVATLRLKYGVISTDEHVQEAPDLWTNRMSRARFGDEIPHIGERDGRQMWLLRGERLLKGRHYLAQVAAAMEPRNRDPVRWEDVPRKTYVPSERLKAMDLDGVDTHTFFPNVAGITNQHFQREGSEEFRLACLRAYNDWLSEEWVAYSPRFIAQCIPPMWSVELAVGEIRRAVKNGHKAVVWHGAPEVLGFPHFQDRQWDPVYETCQELGLPLCLHLGAVPVLPPWEGYGLNTSTAMGSTRAISIHEQVIANVLFSGVFDRFPRLKSCTVESGIGWIPYLLELADHEYHSLRCWEEGLRTKPSDAFRGHMWAPFWYERFALKNRYDIGVDNIIYETDFPHPTSTWPNSRACREESLKDVPSQERRKILWENAAKLYRLDVDASALGG